jgi:hypothetical protein
MITCSIRNVCVASASPAKTFDRQAGSLNNARFFAAAAAYSAPDTLSPRK